MSDSNASLPDDEIRRLLTDEPAEVLSEAQRDRLRSRLGLGAASSGDDERAVADIGRGQDISAPSGTGRSVRGRAVAAIAAAAVVVVGIVSLVGTRGDSGDELRVADSEEVATPATDPTTVPGVESRGAPLCREEIASFTDGVVTWAGVENWAFLTDRRRPAPDLLILAAAAVTAIDEISGTQDTADARARLDELLRDADVVDGPDEPFELSRAERDDYRQAVESAAEAIAGTIEREGWGDLPGCT